jgi:methionyl-tRNA formyltransferase
MKQPSLLEQQQTIIAVVTPAAGNGLQLPVIQPGGRQTTTDLARSAGIPLLTMRSADDAALSEKLDAINPEVILVSCFPYQLPRRICNLASHGSYNLHPSLLPRYRGPDPLFWQFRDGITEAGVSLHRITDMLDAGDIVLQAPVTLTTGMSGSEAEAHMAHAGSQLILQVLEALSSGTLTGTPQDERFASYQPLPTADDFYLDPCWSARRAWHFICGTSERGMPYRYPDGKAWLMIGRADRYADEGIQETAIVRNRDEVSLQFSPGILWVR